MTNKKAARRYNTALYETAVDQKLTEAVVKDFVDMKKSIAGSRELADFLTTPIINLHKKAEVIKSMFSGKLNDLTLKFLELLCVQNRINIITDIIDDFLDLVNQKHGIVTAKIKTAIEISEKEKSAISEKLKEYTGKHITASYSVDPSIKGGFVAQIEDKIIDASILRQLEMLREKFAKGSFNN